MRAALALLLLGALPALAQGTDAPAFGPSGVRPCEPLPGPRGPARLDLDLQGHDLREVLREVARLAGITIEVAPEVHEVDTLQVVDMPWRLAVDLLAQRAGCEVEALASNVLWIDQPTRISATFEDSDVTQVLRVLGAYAGQQVVIGPGVAGRVTVDFRDEPWPRALQTIARAVGAHLVVRPGLALVRAGPAHARTEPAPSRGGRVTLELDEDVSNAIEAVARAAGEDAVVDPNVKAHVRLTLRDAPFRAAVELVARATGCEVEARSGGILLLTRPSRTRYDAVGAPAAAWFQLLAAYSGMNVVVTDVQGRVDCELTGLQHLEVLELTVRATGHAFERRARDTDEDTVVVRGRRASEDLLAPPPREPLDELLWEVERLARDGDARALEPRLAELLALVQARRPAPPAPPAAGPPEEAVRRLGALLERLQAPAPGAARPLLDELRGLVAAHGPGLARVATTRLAKEPLGSDEHQALLLELLVTRGNLLLRALGEALRREDLAAFDALVVEIEAVTDALREGPRYAFLQAAERLYLARHRLKLDARRVREFKAFGLELTATVVPATELEPRSAILNGRILREGDPVFGLDGEELDAMRLLEVRPRSVRIRWAHTDHVLALPR